MELSEIEFELPNALIAQQPAQRRDGSRLLVVDRTTQAIRHHFFSDLPQLLTEPTFLFRNNAMVLKARLAGIRPTGGHVECLLLRPLPDCAAEAECWECLLRPGRKLSPGSIFGQPGEFEARVVSRAGSGSHAVAFTPTRPGESVTDLSERIGRVPLPPYIQRPGTRAEDRVDAERYQTVYADPTRRVAAAAPTAGLHFTRDLLQTLEERGHTQFDLTLHVGVGTFQPVKTPRVEDHAMHPEIYEIPGNTIRALTRAPAEGRKRLAVGTTTVRTIEDFLRKNPQPISDNHRGEAEIFITPPCHFLATDILLTNFHLPRSTLLCLVAAFLSPGTTDGVSWLREIYAVAISLEYRFFSYGDAMLIL